MSRIHEALKKAEQERAATQGGSVQPGLATAPAAELPPYADAPPTTMAAVAAASANQGMPSFGGSFGLDTLMARTAQLEWKPDLGTMLFMNEDDSARGTEEFRTLRSRLYHMREKMTLKTVLVTSALPKEGKSFLCQSGAGHRAAAWAARAADRCRPARAEAPSDVGHDAGTGPLRLFTGKE